MLPFPSSTPFATWLLPLLLQAGSGPDLAAQEVHQLRTQVAGLEVYLRQRDQALFERLRALAEDVKALQEELKGLRHGLSALPESFLNAPSPSSDTVGVAKVAVLGPRLEVESARRHDLITLRVRRIEAEGATTLTEQSLVSDQEAVDLAIDRSGALYVVDWSTSDGLNFNLLLKDGATGQVAATAQIRPYQNTGRFVFVGYRLD